MSKTNWALDVLVNNAGVIAVGSAVDEADAGTRRVLDVDVYGVMLATKLASLRMLPRGHGHIVNVGSVGSVLSAAGLATCSATKHAVLGFTDGARPMPDARERPEFAGPPWGYPQSDHCPQSATWAVLLSDQTIRIEDAG